MGFAKTISAKNREKKWQLFQSLFSISENTKILDVGYSDVEYSDVDNYLEKNYPYQKNITALGIEEPNTFSERYPEVTVCRYDGSYFPFEDDSFDIVWSNAVIEHVGGYEAQKLFLSECARVGKQVFITTPNRWFPIEVHTHFPFIHWLPKPVSNFLISLMGKKWATGAYMNLLSYRKLDKMCSEIGLVHYAIIKNRLWGLTLECIIVINDTDYENEK